MAVEPQLGAPLRSRGMAASLDQRGADTPARMCPSHRELVQICGLPLRASGQNSDPRPTRCNSRRCRRCNSRLGARISGRRSPRMSGRSARRPVGVPLADIHAAASCISRTTSSISPEQATRTFGGSSLSIRSRRGMNRRLIVQFDPDEPSMSAPTFAEPDQC